jgi:hypothetical protein
MTPTVKVIAVRVRMGTEKARATEGMRTERKGRRTEENRNERKASLKEVGTKESCNETKKAPWKKVGTAERRNGRKLERQKVLV